MRREHYHMGTRCFDLWITGTTGVIKNDLKGGRVTFMGDRCRCPYSILQSVQPSLRGGDGNLWILLTRVGSRRRGWGWRLLPQLFGRRLSYGAPGPAQWRPIDFSPLPRFNMSFCAKQTASLQYKTPTDECTLSSFRYKTMISWVRRTLQPPRVNGKCQQNGQSYRIYDKDWFRFRLQLVWNETGGPIKTAHCVGKPILYECSICT